LAACWPSVVRSHFGVAADRSRIAKKFAAREPLFLTIR
jgi:hypothetical protein